MAMDGWMDHGRTLLTFKVLDSPGRELLVVKH